VITAFAAGDPAGALPTVATIAGGIAVVVVCWRIVDQAALVGSVVLIAVGLAATGWIGVAWRITPWALADGSVWRAATLLTYANAAAGVLVLAGMLAVGRSIASPGRWTWTLAVFGLFVGAGATFSRAGALAAAAGLSVLCVAAGPAAVLRSVAAPLVGAAVALAGLVPSLPVGSDRQPTLAAAALSVGVVLTLILSRASRTIAVGLVAGAGVLGAVLVMHTAGALSRLLETRVTLASPDRGAAWGAALRAWRDSPILGTGPGKADLVWVGSDGKSYVARYVHNEYLQVLAEHGLVGAVLLGGLAVAVGLTIRRTIKELGAAGRGEQRRARLAAAAGLVAFAVGSAFDFYWHIPGLLIVPAILVGIATRPPTIGHSSVQSVDA
jgi:hypothetical protein